MLTGKQDRTVGYLVYIVKNLNELTVCMYNSVHTDQSPLNEEVTCVFSPLVFQISVLIDFMTPLGEHFNNTSPRVPFKMTHLSITESRKCALSSHSVWVRGFIALYCYKK